MHEGGGWGWRRRRWQRWMEVMEAVGWVVEVVVVAVVVAGEEEGAAEKAAAASVIGGG